MTARLDITDYQQVFAFIQAHTGLRVHPGRFEEIARVVDGVLNSARLAGVSDLLLTLQLTPFTAPIWQTLIQAITVGETYFFRDQRQIDCLRNHIFPDLIAERRETGLKHLRLWSAGCASGEEPYTLVMLLTELLPDIDAWHITVLGTDINTAFLERARRGLYRPSSFRNETPDYVLPRWFRPTPQGYQLDPAIRQKVTFLPMNLANSSDPQLDDVLTNLDLIICRNVTIYFEQDMVSRIVGLFYRALNEGGRLMVGHSELSTTMYHEFTTRVHDRIVYYQKVSAPPAPVEVPTHIPKHATTRPIAVRPAPARAFAARTAASRRTSRGASGKPVTRPISRPVSRPITRTFAPRKDLLQSAQAKADSDRDLEMAWARAKAAADREQWDVALAALAEVEAAHKFHPEFHYLRGLVQMAAEQVDQALRAWRQAIYCDPKFALAHYSLGELYSRRGDYRAAVRHWQQAMAAIAPLDPEQRLLVSEDLTVDMLRGLLVYLVGALQNGQDREQK